jgi:hypothetical protein
MKKVIRLTESDLVRLVKRVIKEDKFDSSNINEYFGGAEDFKHDLNNLNIEAVLEGLNLLRHYRPKEYNKYFGDRIFSSYESDTN